MSHHVELVIRLDVVAKGGGGGGKRTNDEKETAVGDKVMVPRHRNIAREASMLATAHVVLSSLADHVCLGSSWKHYACSRSVLNA